MAIRYAVANGNWSSTSTWDGGTLPTSADDVFANNFTVVIDQDITVLTLRNAANTSPAISVGGRFVVSTGGYTVTCTNQITSAMIASSTVYLITVSATGGITTLNVGCLFNTTGNNRFITITGNSTVNIVGNLTGMGQNAIVTVLIASQSTVNIVGTIKGAKSNGTQSNASTVGITANNVTLNINGDILTDDTIIGNNPNTGIVWIYTNGTNSIINIIGNLIQNNITVDNGEAQYLIISEAACTVNITGNIIGPKLNYSVSRTCFFSTQTVILNHTGIVYGGDASNNGGGKPAIFNTGNSSITRLSGPFVFGNYGSIPFVCSRVFLTNNTTNYTEYASNSNNGALFPSAAPTRFTMYSPNTLADSPIPANVRQGVTYALSSQTGTLVVPSPSNVRKDIPTDNTVGTADLSAADFWNYLTSNITTANTIGKLIKDNLDAQVSTRLASSSYVAPNNSDITAIKAVTDTLTDVATETTALAIKTRTDLIPDNPASNDSVGAIVASYNV